MKISKVDLSCYRNYLSCSIKLHDKMNVFVGNNAQGKTNFLESIVVLALTKSHRVVNSPNIISFNKSKTKISGIVKKDKLLSKLQIELSENEKKLFINKNQIKRVSDYISNLNVIVFTPDDLEIVKGPPNVRRNLLNIQLSQISRTYLNTYNEYNKILKTRNEYLKILYSNSIADKNYLDILTDKLIEKAIVIYKERKIYLDSINEFINDYFNKISGEKGINLLYLPNIEINEFTDEEIRNVLSDKFKKNFNREMQYGMTMYGPHRDDFIFRIDDKDLKLYGSQGQQKMAILCFKISEIPLFKNYSGFYPVLLLDDIFSELDIKKRNNLLNLINQFNIQSIITTTDLKNINKNNLVDSYIFEVKDGNIYRK